MTCRVAKSEHTRPGDGIVPASLWSGVVHQRARKTEGKIVRYHDESWVSTPLEMVRIWCVLQHDGKK